jgi:hypothetical protein
MTRRQGGPLPAGILALLAAWETSTDLLWMRPSSTTMSSVDHHHEGIGKLTDDLWSRRSQGGRGGGDQ